MLPRSRYCNTFAFSVASYDSALLLNKMRKNNGVYQLALIGKL
jgi:hypothetical protein